MTVTSTKQRRANVRVYDNTLSISGACSTSVHLRLQQALVSIQLKRTTRSAMDVFEKTSDNNTLSFAASKYAKRQQCRLAYRGTSSLANYQHNIAVIRK